MAADEITELDVVDGRPVTDLQASIMQALAGRNIDPARALDPTPVLDPRGNVFRDTAEAVDWHTELTELSLRNLTAGEFDPDRLPPLHEFTAEWVAEQQRDPQAAPILVLFGEVGCGKTSQAIGAVRELAMRNARAGRIYRWRFVTHRNFSAAVRLGKPEAEAIMHQLKHADLLVLDDLGDYNTQDFGVAADYTSRLINHRGHYRLPTIYTTNLTYKRNAAIQAAEEELGRHIATLADSLDDRAVSRLMSGWTAPLPEIDHRAAQGRIMGVTDR